MFPVTGNFINHKEVVAQNKENDNRGMTGRRIKNIGKIVAENEIGRNLKVVK